MEYWTIKLFYSILFYSKTEYMILTRSSAVQSTLVKDITLGNVVVNCSTHIKNLGVVMDSVLNMTKHINNLCRSAHFTIRNIARIRPLLTQSAAEKLVHAFVTTKLDYCNSLLFGLPKYLIKRLQLVQTMLLES